MVLVKITDGILEGEEVINEFGGKYFSFKGIPYAEPPLGDLRFKAPVPVKPWDGVRKAKEFGSVCYQRELFDGAILMGSEDCLYINVYSPDLKPTRPTPVMVWIHGGGFIWGSGNDNMYGPEFLIRHDVILVTFNYRLGPLGFLCLDTKDVPGNAGMKDQVLALRWVQRNITNFGGDPGNVTIFGESAGAASVSFHLLSPMSKGLFKRAIAQSGAANCFWAQPFAPREKALALARKLGTHSEDDKELYEFFKRQPIEAFVDLHLSAVQARKPYEIDFGVVSEKQFGKNERFFYGDVFDVLQDGGIHEEVEIMTGFTEHEGLLAFIISHLGIDQFFNTFNNYVEMFVPKQIAWNRSIKDQLEIGRKIKNYFIKRTPLTMDDYDDFLRYLSYDFFTHEIIEFAKFCAKNKNKTYLYEFTCKSERNQLAKQLGLSNFIKDEPLVGHTEDLMYLFPVKLLNLKVDMSSEAFRMIDNVTKLWTNFAKYGNPTPDESLGVKWLPFDLQKQAYLDISNQLKTGSAPHKEDITFLEGIYKEYLPKCVV